MKDTKSIELYLIKDIELNSLKAQVYKEELDKLNIDYPLSSNQIDIKRTYFNKGKNSIEVGCFIRNGLEVTISLENITLSLRDESNNIIAKNSFNFKNYGHLPPFSAIPVEVTFPMDESLKLQDTDNLSICFEGLDQMVAFNSVATEIENIPENISFEEEMLIKDFSEKLPTLKKDEVSFSTFELSYDEEGGIDCILLIRNGYDKGVKLEQIPVAVFNEDELVIARTVFKNDEGIVVIGPGKAKLIKFHFDEYEVFPQRADLSKCKVLFK